MMSEVNPSLSRAVLVPVLRTVAASKPDGTLNVISVLITRNEIRKVILASRVGGSDRGRIVDAVDQQIRPTAYERYRGSSDACLVTFLNAVTLTSCQTKSPIEARGVLVGMADGQVGNLEVVLGRSIVDLSRQNQDVSEDTAGIEIDGAGGGQRSQARFSEAKSAQECIGKRLTVGESIAHIANPAVKSLSPIT